MSKLFWAVTYAALCLAEFLVGWGKDYVSEQLKGKPPEKPGDE